MNGLGDSIGKGFGDLGSSIGNLTGSMQSAVGDMVGQAVSAVMSSVPLLAGGLLLLAVFVLWFLRRAVG